MSSDSDLFDSDDALSPPTSRSRSRSRSSPAVAGRMSGAETAGLRRTGRRRLTFGRHDGSTYLEVLRSDPGYCQWATRVPAPSGPLRHFANWVRRARQAQDLGTLGGEDDDDNDEEDESEPDDDDEEEGDGLQRMTPQLAALRHQLHQQLSAFLNAEENGGEPAAALARALLEAANTTGNAAAGAGSGLRGRGATEVVDALPRLTFSPALFSGTPYPDSCPICLDSFEEAAGDEKFIVLTPCLHVFHSTCLTSWLQKKRECPSCRWDITDTGEQNILRSTTSTSDGLSEAAAASARALAGTTVVLSDDSQE
eukprot:TRINITY_DN64306_c0_g1_i1.p1 TRINITY_DN64306_c0_g1~~TRINITY_DN64306_c0_g1_i1.p1  ORF type:complete len:311 (+),score=53.64 TRINITY_DN64306_c0_g1_i1:78-1010(+)